MVFQGYILPPQNQKIYDRDVSLALLNYKKDVLQQSIDKQTAANPQFVSSLLPSISEDAKAPASKVINAEDHAKMLVKAGARNTVTDLVDFSDVKQTIKNNDLAGVNIGNDLLNELKTKIGSSNKGLKKPTFKENLVTDKVPINVLMQELTLKLKDPNKGLRQRLNAAKDVIQESNIPQPELVETVDAAVDSSKESLFQSFNDGLNKSPTFEKFKDDYTDLSSTMGDFDEQYLRWNKDTKLYVRILEAEMKKQKLTMLNVFHSKSEHNTKKGTIEFKDGDAYQKQSGKAKSKKLNERALFYTLLNNVSTGKLIGGEIGVKASNKIPNFGNYFMSLNALRKNNLLIYRPKTNSTLITRKNISPTLMKIINSIRSTMKFDIDDYEKLKLGEQKTVDHVINLLHLDYPPKMKRALDEENWNLKNRYEILISEVNAGNSGRMVITELKGVVDKLKMNKVIGIKKHKSIMSALNEF